MVILKYQELIGPRVSKIVVKPHGHQNNISFIMCHLFNWKLKAKTGIYTSYIQFLISDKALHWEQHDITMESWTNVC